MSIQPILVFISKHSGLNYEEINKLIPVSDEKTSSALIDSFENSKKRMNNEETRWTKVTASTLKELRGICHPEWETNVYQTKELQKAYNDADFGVTFAFYWKDKRLCWER